MTALPVVIGLLVFLPVCAVSEVDDWCCWVIKAPAEVVECCCNLEELELGIIYLAENECIG